MPISASLLPTRKGHAYFAIRAGSPPIRLLSRGRRTSTSPKQVLARNGRLPRLEEVSMRWRPSSFARPGRLAIWSLSALLVTLCGCEGLTDDSSEIAKLQAEPGRRLGHL